MLKVKLVFDNHGLGKEEVIGEMVIYNTLDNDRRPEYGNYTVKRYNSLGEEIARGRVVDHRRSIGAWPLIAKAVDSVMVEGKK